MTLPTSVELEGPSAAARRQAEQFVRAAFHAAYGAEIVHFMPDLMTLRSDGGELQAVLGLREPDETPLFLEQYLDRPVERLLGEACGESVERRRLVEVGNFAVGAAGGGRWLITALTAFLHSAGRSWAVFTCGPELRNAFRRLGVPLLDLSPADPTRLPVTERQRWGSYYAQQPRVMAANVVLAHRVLTELLAGEYALHALWHSAMRAGRIAA
jgi:hypothetical protein